MADASRLERTLRSKFSPYCVADMPALEADPLARPAPARRPCALSISTRGLGLSTCNLCYIAASVTDGRPPPLYAMYRAFLGLAEAKLATCPYLIGEKTADNVYNFKVKLYMLERAQTVPIVPEPIKRIIDAIAVIATKTTRYVPVVAGQVRDERGELIPRPENLLLSNLREVVEALARDDEPDTFRAAFKENCPIPGAVWRGSRLLNPDEIIPKDYNLVDSLWDDMWPLSMFLVGLREKYPLMAGGVLQCKSSRNSSRAALISSYMSDLRAKERLHDEPVEEYCRRCHPQGFLGSYYELEEMTDVERVAGQVALLGELPNQTVLGDSAAPIQDIYSLRQGQFDPAGTHVYGDYTTALMLYNEALLSPPRALAGPPPEPRDEPRSECRNECCTEHRSELRNLSDSAPRSEPRNECRGCASNTGFGYPRKRSALLCDKHCN